MKHFKNLFLTLFLLSNISPAIAQESFNLKILHTNDLHAHLIPFKNDGSNCSYETCRGGFARIKSFIDKKRKEDPNLILLDAGDRFSGTIFYTMNKGENISTLMEQMNYDAMALGNHDFDDDLPELEKFEQKITAPLLASNVQFPTESELNKTILPALVIHKNNKQIAILSILTKETKETSSSADKITLLNEKKVLTKYIQKIKENNIDIIILVNHNGIEEDIKLAKAFSDIDVIISAHTHTLLSNNPTENAKGPYPITIEHENGKKTLVVSAGIGGHHVGELNITLNEKGEIISYTGDTIPMDTKIKPDEKIVQYIKDAEEKINKTINNPIIQLTEKIPLTKNGLFCAESCYMGEVLADALLTTAQKNNKEVTVSILNSGGIRSGMPKGEITFKHIAQTYPFDSTAIIVKMTGKELKDYINLGLKNYTNDDRTNAFIQTSGISYSFSEKTKKVTNIKDAQNKTLDDNKFYFIVMPSFLGKGGDGFPKLEPLNVLKGGTIREHLVNYFKNKENLKPFENRIKKDLD